MILSPVYILQVNVAPNIKEVQDPATGKRMQVQDGLSINYGACPICFLAGWDSIELPPGAMMKHVRDIPLATEREELFKAFLVGESLAQSKRLAASGIAMAPNMTGLPRPPGSAGP